MPKLTINRLIFKFLTSSIPRCYRPTDRPTDQRTDTVGYRVACTRLKIKALQVSLIWLLRELLLWYVIHFFHFFSPCLNDLIFFDFTLSVLGGSLLFWYTDTVNSIFYETGGTWQFISLKTKFAIRLCSNFFNKGSSKKYFFKIMTFIKVSCMVFAMSQDGDEQIDLLSAFTNLCMNWLKHNDSYGNG